MPLFRMNRPVLICAETEAADLAEALAIFDDIEVNQLGPWEIEEYHGDPDYWEVTLDDHRVEIGSHLLTVDEVSDAQAERERRETLDANAKYGGPNDRAAEETLDSGPSDIGREEP